MFGLTHLVGFAAGGAQLYPTSSIDFEASSSQWLSMSHANFTAGGTHNRSKCAWSFWIKPESDAGRITTKKTTSPGEWDLRISGSNLYFLFFASGGAGNGSGNTTGGLLPNGTWKHVLIHFDRANATTADRVKIWINGSSQTISSYVAPTADLQTTTDPVQIGSEDSTGNNFFDGLLYQFAFFSNYLPSVSEVYDSTSSKPKDIRAVTGLFSMLDVAGGSVTSDYVLSNDWTNNNTAVSSSDTP